MKNTFITTFNNFVKSKWYYIALAVIAVAVHGLALDFVGYYLIAMLFVGVTLFCDDYNHIIPLAMIVTLLVSTKYGYANTGNNDYYYSTFAVINFVIIVTLCLAVAIYRLIINKQLPLTKFRPILISVIALAVALLLNSIDISTIIPSIDLNDYQVQYNFGSTVFGGIILLTWFFPALVVVLLCKKINMDVLAHSAVTVAVIVILQLIIQVIRSYVAGQLFVEGTNQIAVSALCLGWGFPNNVGARLVLSLPLIIYLARTRQNGYLYYIFAIVTMLFVALTLSRNALLFGGLFMVVATIYLLVTVTNKRPLVITVIACAVVAILGLIIIGDKVLALLGRLIETGLDDNGRYEIWLNGLRVLSKNLLFGVGFYTPAYPNSPFLDVFNNMYHNFLLQMLISCGIIGITALVIFLVQLTKLMFQNKSTNRLALSATIVMSFMLSLLDNHVYYSAFALTMSLCIGYLLLDNHSTNELIDTNSLA